MFLINLHSHYYGFKFLIVQKGYDDKYEKQEIRK